MYNFNLNFIPDRNGVYIVGGSVRDAMLGHPPKDYDITVTGGAKTVAEEISRQAGSRVIEIGKQAKKIYRVIAADHTYDIWPAQDNSIDNDLKRRDFTINAMAFDVHCKKIIDPLNGIADLKAGIVRMTHPGVFEKDPLRLLRAFRIAAVLGFEISRQTMSEIQKNAMLIKKTPGERVREEWLKLLGSSGSYPYIKKLDETKVLAALFPELQNLKNCLQNTYHRFDVFTHTLETYRHLEKILHKNSPGLSRHHTNKSMVYPPAGCSLIKHAALFHDTGKPQTRTIRYVNEKEKINFYGHDFTGAFMTGAISDRLRFSRLQKNYVHYMVLHHLRPLFLFTALSQGAKTNPARTRFFIKTTPFCTDLMLLFVADMLGKKKDRDDSAPVNFARRTIEAYFGSFYPKSVSGPLINGNDLIVEFGLEPSPLFSEILGKLETQRLFGNICSRKAALKFAENLIRSKSFFCDSNKRKDDLSGG